METTLFYPAHEVNLKRKIDSLNATWQQIVAKENPLLADLYVSDGFYPYYSEQNTKILFIAKESLGMSGDDYIETLCNAYRAGIVGNKSLNAYQLHALMHYVAYGLLHGCPDYDTIPTAKEIGKGFATPSSISFAFMNLSKLSNDSGRWEANLSLIEQFVDISSRHKENLWAKEIALLQPDVIIGMNLGQWYGRIGRVSNFKHIDSVCLQTLTIDYCDYKLIDTYHFAYIKNWKEGFYLPIMKAFQAR